MDFNPLFETFDDMLRNDYAWELVDNNVFTVKNMNEKELKESIIQDLLSVTMWEIKTKEDVHFSLSTLCRKVPREYVNKIKQLIKAADICDMIHIRDKRIRIYNSQKNLQAAMNYCGVWFEGYAPPKGTKVIDTGKVRDAVNELGSVDALATSLSMDIKATITQSTKTIH